MLSCSKCYAVSQMADLCVVFLSTIIEIYDRKNEKAFYISNVTNSSWVFRGLL